MFGERNKDAATGGGQDWWYQEGKKWHEQLVFRWFYLLSTVIPGVKKLPPNVATVVTMFIVLLVAALAVKVYGFVAGVQH